MAKRRRKYNVQATFPTPEAAAKAARDVREFTDAGSVAMNRPADREAAVRGEMRDEVESMVASVGNVGPFTKSMTKGFLVLAPIGAILGAGLGLLIGVFGWGDVSMTASLVIGGACGAVAGATAGFVVGGYLKPEVTEEHQQATTAETGTVVGVHTNDPREADRAERALRQHGPARVSRSSRTGEPRRPSSEDHTRPVRGS